MVTKIEITSMEGHIASMLSSLRDPSLAKSEAALRKLIAQKLWEKFNPHGNPKPHVIWVTPVAGSLMACDVECTILTTGRGGLPNNDPTKHWSEVITQLGIQYPHRLSWSINSYGSHWSSDAAIKLDS